MRPILGRREGLGLGAWRADTAEGGCGQALAVLVPADRVVSLGAQVATLIGLEVPDQGWCGRLAGVPMCPRHSTATLWTGANIGSHG